jgi:undecaprenyl-phosphate galactose phosphotransferase/putative colanic acid biosynthesis UDP-glucose lipid carrier transferase
MTDMTGIARATAFDRRSSSGVGVRFEVVEPLLVLANALIIMVAGILGGALYHLSDSNLFADWGVQVGLGVLASLSYGVIAHHFGLYRINVLLENEQGKGRVLLSWALALLVVALALFLLKSGTGTSRGSAVCFAGLGGIGLVLLRHVASPWLRSALMTGAIRGRRAVVIGTQGELAQFTRQDLLARFGLDEVERVVLPRDDVRGRLPMLHRAGAETALRAVRQHLAEEIILVMSWSELADFEPLLDELRVVPLPVRLLPDRAVSAVLRRQSSDPQRFPMVEMQRTPLTRIESGTKRLLDIVIAITSLIALSPLLTFTAVAIKLESRGPVIFRQRRHGFNGQAFIIWKFRTMKVQEDGAAVVQARKADPRITRVGRFLRETSIDELPQLWNVLLGNMSIVGPRPHALIHDYEYGKMIANYAFRHHVKPGITGWAQVKGFRGGTPQLELMQQRVQHDLWYIDNWSLSLDVLIIIKTMFEVLRRNNAY